MPVTVRWLLRHPELHLAAAGGSDDLSREIDFVVTTELADPAQWLSGGELVLTTGIGLLDRTGAVADRAGCDRYVQRLVERGIVALGFGVGLTFDDIPQDLVDAAAAARLPLIVVPRPTPFVAIARAVADRSAELQYRAQELAARAQPRMTRAAVSGGAVALLKELATACDGAALLLDDDGRVTQSAPAGVSPAVMRAVGEQVRGHRTSSAVTIGAETAIVTQPIRVAGRTYGHLAVASRHEPRPTDHVLIGHANSLLALDFDKPHRLDALAVRVNIAVFTLLLGDEPDGAHIQTLAVDAADGHGRVRVLVCRDLGANAGRVAGLLGARLTELRRPAFAVARPDGEVAVLLRGTDGEEAIAGLLGALPRSARRHVRAGVSSSVPLTAVADGYRDAITIAGTALRGGPVADRTSAAGVSLVATTDGRAALDVLSRLLIDPLVAYDDAHGTALTESLRSYLENHGQWETAATDLGVHRHTLRARIAKVETELGVDLGSARVRAELLLALLIRT
ncbi:PucR family transcriptional regulator ligand-binding domain-containing protein [Gordonia sp. PDNC005]|uniref:PucR family transcriptional regulator n=1 Tax=Gordonia sp. PDNC005 TaxID=2811424 RepID=UPI0019664B7A|nr:PucR family transcriptional regulator [Gordonia sp. PDNC005]QRY63628.1 PucR family transcriptional regulator ligand-binding domain-containing protein [Gordonia sp. PDNC005]